MINTQTAIHNDINRYIKLNKSVKKLNKMVSYRKETALQGASVLAKSGRLQLRDDILRILYYV